MLNEFWTSPEEIPEYRQEMIKIIEAMLGDNDQTLVDCGCGSGLLFRYLPDEIKARYNGIDFTQDMIDFCKREFPKHKKRFNQYDLTKSFEQDHVPKGDVFVTQNVIQHILLFQEALDMIFLMAQEAVVFCERTHNTNTFLAGYEPAFRWRFNELDFLLILEHYANKWGYEGDVEILAHPKTTKNESDMLTIYRVYRNKKVRAKYDLTREPSYLVPVKKEQTDFVGIIVKFLKQFDIRD